jgi:CubicO group peptidase (beta-lactamase class C family)
MSPESSSAVTTRLEGSTDPAFAPVREAFSSCFAELGEVGAACAIYVEGRKVVDLWGGHQDAGRARPWLEDTLVGFYSVGKPLAALCLLQLVESGEIQLDAPVCRYWPDFAAAGKQEVSVRQVLCHQAGLPAIRQRLPEGAMLDWELMARALAAERPWWRPGTRHVYHTNTYGFLVGELVRRVTGVSLGQRFRERIARPIAADLAFGLAEPDLPRVAEILWQPSGAAPDTQALDRPMPEEERMIAHGYMNPSGFSGLGVMNTREWRMAEVPSTNGHGTARGVARVYAALAEGGELDGVRLLDSDLLREATSEQSVGPCPVLEREVSFGLGFQLTRPERAFGPNGRSFGHFGTGGSLGFADPEARVGFGYVLNHIIPRWQSPRNRALVAALYRCL